MSGSVIALIGIPIIITGLVSGIILANKDSKLSSIFGVMIPIVAFGFLLGVIGMNQMGDELKIADKADKDKIDSMTCQSLGKYIIDTASNKTDNYAYAQAKYLVCTHGGLSS